MECATLCTSFLAHSTKSLLLCVHVCELVLVPFFSFLSFSPIKSINKREKTRQNSHLTYGNNINKSNVSLLFFAVGLHVFLARVKNRDEIFMYGRWEKKERKIETDKQMKI